MSRILRKGKSEEPQEGGEDILRRLSETKTTPTWTTMLNWRNRKSRAYTLPRCSGTRYAISISTPCGQCTSNTTILLTSTSRTGATSTRRTIHTQKACIPRSRWRTNPRIQDICRPATSPPPRLLRPWSAFLRCRT